MTKEEIEALARSVDNEELSKQPGMVCQIWQDGEITTQKSGDLLWQRTLHCTDWQVPGAESLGLEFPHRNGKNTFAWVTYEDAKRVREAVRSLTIEMLERLP